MGAKRGTTEHERSEMARLRASGLSYTEIARHIGCSRPNVAFILQSAGDPKAGGEHHGGAPANQLQRRLSGYTNWCEMRARCSNPRHPQWARYGGAGVSVYPVWHESFAAFIAAIGPRPSLDHTIDRYPNASGNYEPGNVRWALPVEQVRNRRNTLRVDGVALAAAAASAGVPYHVALRRMKAGASSEQILSPAWRPNTGCSVPGCRGHHQARGLCNAHYRRALRKARHRPADVAAAFTEVADLVEHGRE